MKAAAPAHLAQEPATESDAKRLQDICTFRGVLENQVVESLVQWIKIKVDPGFRRWFDLELKITLCRGLALKHRKEKVHLRCLCEQLSSRSEHEPSLKAAGERV